MVQRPPLSTERSETPSRYAVTRLIEPCDGRSPRRSRHGAQFLGLVVLLLAGASAALPGGLADLTEAPAPPRSPAPASVTEGEWVRLVGTEAPDAAPEPLPRGWSLEVPARPAPPLLGGQSALWDAPKPLTEVIEAARRSIAPYRLAEAGGEFRVLNGYAPPWQWATMTGGAPVTSRITVSLPPALDGFAHHSGLSSWVDGVNYADPIGVGLPLLRVGGFEDAPVSAHFRVRDFSTRDGAPFARIAVDLVSGLERMRALVGPVVVISGYRHPRYNALASVGGARYSRHQTGQAADIWSETHSSVDLARAAIEAMGCGIGVGLGRNTVHVDVRGYLSTWTYPGSPLGRTAFDRWVRELCGGAAVPPPPFEAAPLDPTWLALVEGTGADVEEAVHLSDEAVEDAVNAAEAPVAVPAVPTLDALVRRDLTGFAAAAFADHGLGVVVVDLRDGAAPDGVDLVARARYVGARSPEAIHLGLRPLREWVARQPEGTYFLYAVRYANGAVDTGVAPTAPAPRPTPAPPAASTPAPTAPTPPQVAPVPSTQWLLIVASRTSLSGAEADLERYAPPLTEMGLTPVLRIQRTASGLRYEVVVGPFGSTEAATDARGRLDPILPARAEITRVD